MKFLVVGDLHIRSSTFNDLKKLEDILLGILRNDSFQRIILLGDVLHDHEKIHAISMNRAIDFIDTLRTFCKVVVLVGNHDFIQNTQFLTSNHWMNGLKKWHNVQIIDKVEIDEDFPNVAYVPYVYPGRFHEALATNSSYDPLKIRLLFAHQEFYGACFAGRINETGDIWDINHPLVISGHIHGFQKPQKNITYIGAPFHNSFAEKEEATFVMTIDKETLHEEYIQLSLSRRITLTVQTIDELKEAQEDIERGLACGNIYRVIFSNSWTKYLDFRGNIWVQSFIKTFKLKILFRPLEEESYIEDSALPSENASFADFLTQKVLEHCDEYIYAEFSSLVHNKEINPQNILLIPLRCSAAASEA